jgi:hypothetical protein
MPRVDTSTIKDIVIALVFYVLGELRASHQQRELKNYIRERQDYEDNVWRQLEAQGVLRVPRNDEGDPTDVQIIRGGGIPSLAGAGGGEISVGPPPTPPQSVRKDLSLRRRVDEAPRDQRETG